MKTLNRILLTLVLAVGIALAWSWVSRTGWAASVSLLGVGEDYANALQPMIKVAAAIAVMVTATQLVTRTYQFLSARVMRRPKGRSHSAVRVRGSVGFPSDATR